MDEAEQLAPIDHFEIAPENYMHRGGYFPAMLSRVAERFPIFAHGLTLSVGGTDPLDEEYLADLRRFFERFPPIAWSDHLSFSSVLGLQTHDLLPLPFTFEAARHAASRVREASSIVGRPLAIENITYYLVPGEREMDEAAFLCEVLERADCGLLLDVNNVLVNWQNHHEIEPIELLSRLPLSRVVALHAAGHEHKDDRYIDTHGADIPDPVHALVEWVIERTGPLPVIVERDHNIPPFEELLAEVKRVRAAYDRGALAFEARTRSGEPDASKGAER